MAIRNRLILIVVALGSQLLSAEESKVVKITNPLIVSIDRRPGKNIKYSKCIAVFRTEKGDRVQTAVDVGGERVCPALENLTIDNREDRAISDAGNTISTRITLDDDEFRRAYSYKGKMWKIMNGHYPTRIVAKIQEGSDSGARLEDTFFVSVVWNEESQERMVIVSDKANTIT